MRRVRWWRWEGRTTPDHAPATFCLPLSVSTAFLNATETQKSYITHLAWSHDRSKCRYDRRNQSAAPHFCGARSGFLLQFQCSFFRPQKSAEKCRKRFFSELQCLHCVSFKIKYSLVSRSRSTYIYTTTSAYVLTTRSHVYILTLPKFHACASPNTYLGSPTV